MGQNGMMNMKMRDWKYECVSFYWEEFIVQYIVAFPVRACLLAIQFISAFDYNDSAPFTANTTPNCQGWDYFCRQGFPRNLSTLNITERHGSRQPASPCQMVFRSYLGPIDLHPATNVLP